MKSKAELIEMINKYRKINRELDDKCGPSEAGDIFEKVIELGDDILMEIGLPPADMYTSLLWGDHDPADVVEALMTSKEDYDNRPIKDPVLTLVNAAIEHIDEPFNILPMSGFSRHDYQIFLFSEMLLNCGNFRMWTVLSPRCGGPRNCSVGSAL
jgi:hypothetical protein